MRRIIFGVLLPAEMLHYDQGKWWGREIRRKADKWNFTSHGSGLQSFWTCAMLCKSTEILLLPLLIYTSANFPLSSWQSSLLEWVWKYGQECIYYYCKFSQWKLPLRMNWIHCSVLGSLALAKALSSSAFLLLLFSLNDHLTILPILAVTTCSNREGESMQSPQHMPCRQAGRPGVPLWSPAQRGSRAGEQSPAKNLQSLQSK